LLVLIDGLLKAPGKNTDEENPYFLQMPSLDGTRWEAHLAQTVGLEVPIANGNGSIMFYHVDEDLNAGIAYSRTFAGVPLRPSFKSDLTTAGYF